MGTINPVRIRLRYPDLDSFVERFAPNVTRGGVFLASRNVREVGEVIDFEIQLVSGEVALAGRGKVTWVKEFNPAEPNRPFGMGVQFVEIVGQSRAVLARILRGKAVGQAAPRGLTGMHATLGGDAGSGGVVTAGAASVGDSGGMRGGAGGPNGRAPVFVDTSVDLAAELGVDEAALRFALDRRRAPVGGGRVDDDLSDLLRRDPVEMPTLAQALNDLPRLLDPQISRRRAVAGLRAQSELVAPPIEVAPVGIAATPALDPATTADPAETTTVSEGDPLQSDDGGAAPAAVIREPSSGNRSGRRGRHHHR